MRIIQRGELSRREQTCRHSTISHSRTDIDELFRMRKRQGPQQHGVDNAEDRRCGADPDRERRHGGTREARHLPKLANCVPDVLSERVHGCLASKLDPASPRNLTTGQGQPKGSEPLCPFSYARGATPPLALTRRSKTRASLG